MRKPLTSGFFDIENFFVMFSKIPINGTSYLDGYEENLKLEIFK